jgi:phage N-6-adenine-methyltransferase
MNSALMFSKASDEWSTPFTLFNLLDEEFHFELDAAARSTNRLCEDYFGPDRADEAERDGLASSWCRFWRTIWINPPYSKCHEFISKAAIEARRGCTVVCLVPSRTDTRWWHEHVWEHDKPRPGVEVRFLKGRVKFGEGKNSAPFPSVVIIFRGVK